jgi:hypothetical protein
MDRVSRENSEAMDRLRADLDACRLWDWRPAMPSAVTPAPSGVYPAPAAGQAIDSTVPHRIRRRP